MSLPEMLRAMAHTLEGYAKDIERHWDELRKWITSLEDRIEACEIHHEIAEVDPLDEAGKEVARG